MSRKKINNFQNKISQIEDARKQILSKLLSATRIVRGSYARVYTKCGKNNCWCKDAKGHPHSRITWCEEGKGFTRKVPPDQISWIQKTTESYREFKSWRRELANLQIKSKKLMDEFENILIQTTRKGKIFLDIIEQNRRKKSG